MVTCEWCHWWQYVACLCNSIAMILHKCSLMGLLINCCVFQELIDLYLNNTSLLFRQTSSASLEFLSYELTNKNKSKIHINAGRNFHLCCWFYNPYWASGCAVMFIKLGIQSSAYLLKSLPATETNKYFSSTIIDICYS